MKRFLSTALSALFCIFSGFLLHVESVHAQDADIKRYALVIGNSAYQFQALASSASQDAVLVANALASQGYEVIGARDLNQKQLAETLMEFKERITPTADQNLIVVYLAGRFVQVANQNFFLPVDYRPIEPIHLGNVGLRLTDLQNFLTGLAAKGQVVLVDSGNSVPVPLKDFRPVPGLAVLKPIRNSAVSMNTTPGILGADFLDPVGPYARALAEAIRRGSTSNSELFDFVRIRQLELTRGDSIAHFSSTLERSLVLFPPTQDPIKSLKALQQMPLKDAPKASIAFAIALGRGTPDALDEFNFLYPANPLVRRTKIILAAMRDARIWTQVLSVDKPEAYWAYLKVFPQGGHSAEARLRLSMLDAPKDPPNDAALLVLANPPSSVDEADLVIKYSPIALDDEKLRLQAAVLPYKRLIGPIADSYKPKPVSLNKGSHEIPVLPWAAKASGQIMTPQFSMQ